MIGNIGGFMDSGQIALELIKNMDVGAYFVDLERTIRFWNDAAEKICGYSKEEIIGKHCSNSNLQHFDADGRPLCNLSCPLYESNIDGGKRTTRVYLRKKNGKRVRVRIHVVPIRDENSEIIGSMELFFKDSDMEYEDDFIEKLTKESLEDELTSLPNRRFMEESLKFRMSDYKNLGVKFAVIFADIDNFKKFNDDYGHDMGDYVLRKIAKIFKGCTRENDRIGRWGGEEFLGVFAVETLDEVRDLSERIRKLVQDIDILHDGKNINVTISVGGAIVEDNYSIDELVREADRNMYKSKKNGKNCVTVS